MSHSNKKRSIGNFVSARAVKEDISGKDRVLVHWSNS